MRFTWPIPNDALHTGSSVAVVSGNRTLPFRVFAALLAGMIAVAANIALLSIASTAGIRTAQGGLFLLFTRIIHRVAPSRSFMDGWKIFAPPVSQTVFHIVTSLVMAIFYAVVLEPKLPGRRQLDRRRRPARSSYRSPCKAPSRRQSHSCLA